MLSEVARRLTSDEACDLFVSRLPDESRRRVVKAIARANTREAGAAVDAARARMLANPANRRPCASCGHLMAYRMHPDGRGRQTMV